MLTAERLRELLHYDPKTGAFTWIVARPKCRVGEVAGGLTEKGYRKIRIDGRKYLAHRLAWLYMTGEWPADEIDHERSERDDNRWVKLRPADRLTNQRNQKRFRTNTSGVTGVAPAGKKWSAYIGGGSDRKQIQLGTFAEFDDAVQARKTAEVALWGGGHLQQSGTNAGR